MPHSRAGPCGSSAMRVPGGACTDLEDQLAHAKEGLALRAARRVALAHAAQVEARVLEHRAGAVEIGCDHDEVVDRDRAVRVGAAAGGTGASDGGRVEAVEVERLRAPRTDQRRDAAARPGAGQAQAHRADLAGVPGDIESGACPCAPAAAATKSSSTVGLRRARAPARSCERTLARVRPCPPSVAAARAPADRARPRAAPASPSAWEPACAGCRPGLRGPRLTGVVDGGASTGPRPRATGPPAFGPGCPVAPRCESPRRARPCWACERSSARAERPRPAATEPDSAGVPGRAPSRAGPASPAVRVTARAPPPAPAPAGAPRTQRRRRCRRWLPRRRSRASPPPSRRAGRPRRRRRPPPPPRRLRRCPRSPARST